MIGSLADLLHPHDPAELDRAALEHRPLFLPGGQARAFQSLVTWQDIADQVTVKHIQNGRVLVIRQGHVVPQAMFLDGPKPPGGNRIATERFHDLCRQGISVVVHGVEQSLPRVAAMTAAIERHFQAPVGTNAYATFERQSAFPMHWDDHNVLILQVQGRKHWALFGQPVRLPHEKVPFARVNELVGTRKPHWERVLEPGDILFVPRGEVHRTEVADAHSLHLTISISPPRGDSALRWLLERTIGAEEVLRRDVTPLAGQAALRQQAADLRAAMARILDGLDLEAFLAEENRTREPNRPLTLGLLPLAGTGVRVAPALRRPIPLDDDADIEAGSSRHRLTTDQKRVLAVLMERGSLTPDALAEALPALAPAAIEDALGVLARKSLIHVFAD